jgi:hypothetical protein
VAAVIVACVWEDMLDGFDPQQIRPANAPDDEAALAEINAAFGFLGKSTVEECWIEYTRKLGAWRVGLEGVKSGLEHLPDRSRSLFRAGSSCRRRQGTLGHRHLTFDEGQVLCVRPLPILRA